MTTSTGSASGRLDLLGGVADYAGALVLEAPTRARLTVSSEVPIAMGASSSAALEVATARAVGAHRSLPPLALAALCQAAENHVVGAPCGIMDQIAVTVGVPGAVLPVLCRPASHEDPIPLPDGIELVGWPSGAAHDVAGDPYGRARAASFMGKRIAEDAAGAVWMDRLTRDVA